VQGVGTNRIGKDPQNPILNENMNWFEFKFDQINTQEPFTGFPGEKVMLKDPY
jgi:hypothetical protein